MYNLYFPPLNAIPPTNCFWKITNTIIIGIIANTEPAINTCKDALRDTVIVLCKLEEIVMLLEQEKDIKSFFEAKINAAIIDRNPMAEVNLRELAS